MSAILAAATLAVSPVSLRDLDWLAGSWLSCRDGTAVSEIWTDSRSQVLLGISLTQSAGGSTWEQLRVEVVADGAIYLHASPRGQREARFRLVRSGPAEAVFENPAHDFPQRVIYRRDGERLAAEIQGRLNGRTRRQSWLYERAPLGARCPA